MPHSLISRPSVVVVHQGALGDTVLALPMLSSLKRAYPDHPLILAATHPVARLFPGRTAVDATLTITSELLAPDVDPLLPAFVALHRHLQRASLIVVCIFPEVLVAKPAVLKRIPGSAHIALPWFAQSDGHQDEHLSDQQVRFLRLSGLPLPDPGPSLIKWKGAPQDPLQASFSAMAPYVCLSPGAGAHFKRWPLASWRQLAGLVDPYHVVWNIGPHDFDFRFQLLKAFGDQVVVARDSILAEHDLARQALVLAGARAVVGNDSGLTHLAAALGVPTIALFGPTNHHNWAPRGLSVRILTPPHPCRDLRRLDVATVAGALDDLLADTFYSPLVESE